MRDLNDALEIQQEPDQEQAQQEPQLHPKLLHVIVFIVPSHIKQESKWKQTEANGSKREKHGEI
jgi:hypothetical protein